MFLSIRENSAAGGRLNISEYPGTVKGRQDVTPLLEENGDGGGSSRTTPNQRGNLQHDTCTLGVSYI